MRAWKRCLKGLLQENKGKGVKRAENIIARLTDGSSSENTRKALGFN